MPRSRRRRVNDRRREADQRRVAREALEKRREVERTRLDRYIKSVFRNRAGETVEARDGRIYRVGDDGSLVRVEREGLS